MAGLAIKIDSSQIVDESTKLLRVGFSNVKRAALDAVNEVADRTFDDSVTRMTARVNLTQAYVKDRMTVEHAKDVERPEALVIAFRDGGRKRVRPVNLRQYSPVQQKAVNDWSNTGVNRVSGFRLNLGAVDTASKFAARPGGARLPWMPNPRKAGSKLPFIPRYGAAQLGIQVGQKQAGISIEVLHGQRKSVSYAFVAKANNVGTLVFKRAKGDTEGKGKLIPVYSLAVWQLFRKTAADIIPLVTDDLSNTLISKIDKELSSIA